MAHRFKVANSVTSTRRLPRKASHMTQPDPDLPAIDIGAPTNKSRPNYSTRSNRPKMADGPIQPLICPRLFPIWKRESCTALTK